VAELRAAAESLGLRAFPSLGNFVLVNVRRDAMEVYRGLLREGVIVRPMDAWGLPEHLRISLPPVEELARVGIDRPEAGDVSEAVIRLRQRKLPDPAVIGNAGSFFKNPVLEPGAANELAGRFPGLPAWPADEGAVKCSAAWMIEHCGLKGFREGDAGVSDRHALVLVNHGSASGKEILAVARRVQDTVENAFGVRLEPEPRIIEFSH
jgi:UDP-N-acetylenolpyruvoylglucosamine reductase